MIEKLTEYMRRFAHHPYAAIWLFLYAVIESVIFPVPPDVLLVPLALANPNRAVFFATIAAIGSVVGGMAGYAIGYFAFEPIALPVLRWMCQYSTTACPETFVPMLERLFEKHGVWVVGVSAMSPVIPYRFTILAAGLAHMALVPFIIVSLLAHWLRYALVSVLTARLGPAAIGLVSKRLPLAFAATGAIALVIYLLFQYI
ncbi:MAG: cytochrome [Alphaproteobacteria bacterium]|nr:cytochrome [Alphaproteobacteria bacterium]